MRGFQEARSPRRDGRFHDLTAHMADYVLPAASALEKTVIHGSAYYRRFGVREAAVPPV